MNNLVERVARIIARDYGRAVGKADADAAAELSWDIWVPESRAAIREVAAWLDDALKNDDGRIYVPQFLRLAVGEDKTAENKQLREHIAELEAELEEPEPVSWLAKPEEKKERDPDEWREWEHEKERIRKEFGE